jgi:hypothetical protein
MDNGISYALFFDSDGMNTEIDVQATGCEGLNIDGDKSKWLIGNKNSDKFWVLLAKDLGTNESQLKGMKQK